MIPLAILGLMQGLMSTAGAMLQSSQEEQNYRRGLMYNSPANQMQLYHAAGLNPYMATGGFTPVGVSPNNISSGAGNASRAMSQVISGMIDDMNSADANQIKRLNTDINLKKYLLQDKKWNLISKQVQQSIDRGNIGMAMDILNYNTAVETQPDIILKSHESAKQSKIHTHVMDNNAKMSDYQAETYKQYRDNIIEEIAQRIKDHKFDRSYKRSKLRLDAADQAHRHTYDKKNYELRESHENTYQDYKEKEWNRNEKRYKHQKTMDYINAVSGAYQKTIEGLIK